MSDTVPIIDIGPLREGGAAGTAAVAARIGRVAREVGFFYIANHGVPAPLVEAVFAEMAGYFAQPLADKQTLSYKNSKSNTGYFAIGDEYLDSVLLADAKEAFQINRDIAADDPDYLAGKPFHAPNQWPADRPRFRPVMLDYFAIQKRLCEQLHGAFAIDLGLAPDFFAPYIDRPLATLRLLHYPPHPGRFDGTRCGASPHTDFGNLTILAQDDAGGLEVQTRGGDWIPALPIAGTFLCNIGDCLMRWSNDIYRSTPHRVVNRSGRDRYSAAFFHDPNYEAPVECLPTCTDAAHPPRYPATTGGAYLSMKLAEAFGYAGR